MKPFNLFTTISLMEIFTFAPGTIIEVYAVGADFLLYRFYFSSLR